MDYGYLSSLLSVYGISAVIIGALVATVSFILEKLFCGKLKNGIKAYFPFIAGILFSFIYSVIFFGFKESLKTEILYSGACSGSLGIMIKTMLKQIFKGKTAAKSQTALLIEGIICEHVDKNLTEAVAAIEKVLAESYYGTTRAENIALILKEYMHKDAEKDELYRLSDLVAKAVETLKNTN